jgi:hypothetical protein
MSICDQGHLSLHRADWYCKFTSVIMHFSLIVETSEILCSIVLLELIIENDVIARHMIWFLGHVSVLQYLFVICGALYRSTSGFWEPLLVCFLINMSWILCVFCTDIMDTCWILHANLQAAATLISIEFPDALCFLCLPCFLCLLRSLCFHVLSYCIMAADSQTVHINIM